MGMIMCDYMIQLHKIVVLLLLESLPPLLTLRKQVAMLENPTLQGTVGDL